MDYAVYVEKLTQKRQVCFKLKGGSREGTVKDTGEKRAKGKRISRANKDT